MKFYEVMKLAIDQKKKVKVTFYSKEDNRDLTRLYAPFDIGPSRITKHDKSDRYHFWNYESDTRNHTLSLVDAQVKEISITELNFEPKDLITWNFIKNSWFLPRNWGDFS